MGKNFFWMLLALAVLLVCDVRPGLSAADRHHFPVYDAMRPNVAFWKTVYGKYPTSKGLIHDNRDLSIIYEVIDLEPRERAGAEKRNTARVDRAKEKYASILRSLARGNRPDTAEERRVLALFDGKPSAGRLAKAAESVRFQLCLKDHFAEGVVRSGAYLSDIKKIMRSYGLPEELAYLPHVESSFNYKAYSKAGAAGIWQFTRDTGSRYMTINYTVDERRDPLRATHAAARFLKHNYEKLGSWPLALTAYNHGTTGMLRAKNAMGGYDTIFRNYEGNRFGFASRNFYAEFIAAVEVAKNYQHYFGTIRLDPPVAHHEVVMTKYAPVKDLARHFKVDLATLQELNPALRPPVFEGRKHVPKGYTLRLPSKGRGVAVASTLPSDILVDRQQPSRFYRVRKGDTASTVARRNGVSLADLAAANDLDGRMAIHAGQNLRIPVREEKIVPVPGRAGAGAVVELSSKPLKVAAAKKETAPAAELPGAGVPAELTAKTVKVAATDKGVPVVDGAIEPASAPTPVEIPATVLGEEEFPLLAAVGAKKAVSAAAKSVTKDQGEGEENGAAAAPETVLDEESGRLETKAALDRLPSEALAQLDVNPRVVVGDLQVEDVRRGKGRSASGMIRVEAGETIGHYATWLGVPARTVLRWNNLRSAASIRFGQRLKLSFDKVAPETFEERRYEYHKEIEEDFFAAYRIEGARLYRVKEGDNIWKLCAEEFRLPAWLVRKYNTAHNFNSLKQDDQLIIPVVTRIEEG